MPVRSLHLRVPMRALGLMGDGPESQNGCERRAQMAPELLMAFTIQ